MVSTQIFRHSYFPSLPPFFKSHYLANAIVSVAMATHILLKTVNKNLSYIHGKVYQASKVCTIGV